MLEYVGAAAVIAGDRGERSRCWDYLSWLLKQRRGGFHVSPDGRDDVTELRIPKGAAGRLQGNRGETLRAIEKVRAFPIHHIPPTDYLIDYTH